MTLLAIAPQYIRADWLTGNGDEGDDSLEEVPGRIIVRGPLGSSWWGTDYAGIRGQLASAVKAGCRTVVMDFDSPGGAVAGVSETVAAIQAARRDCNVIAYVSGMCLSAAYWLAAACDRVYVSPTGMVGCVGAVASVVDDSAAEKKYGITTYRYTSTRTPSKAPEPGTNESAAEMQRVVDAAGDAFLSDLARLRNIKGGLDAVATAYQLGKTLPAADALAAGWVDEMAAQTRDYEWLMTGSGPVPTQYTLPPMRPGAAKTQRVAMGGRMADTIVSPIAALAALGFTAEDGGNGRLVLSPDDAARLVGQFNAATAQAQGLKLALETAKTTADTTAAELAAIRAQLDARAIGDLVDTHVKRGAIAPGQRDAWVTQATALGLANATATLNLLPVSAPMAPVAAAGVVTLKAGSAAAPVDFGKLNAEALALVTSKGITFDAAIYQLSGGKFGNYGVGGDDQKGE